MRNNTTENNLWSISFSYRLGLGFHALNNEGSDGSNLMQPRRIDVGKLTYDGISGEIIRHHILENFVNICRKDNINMLPLSEGLHPDRGPLGIRHAAHSLDRETLSSTNLVECSRNAITNCAVLDIGGFLAAFEKNSPPNYIIESAYINNSCATLDNDNFPQPIKRESCFDVAWLISEEPQDYTVTQHSAYRDTASLNSRYAQAMRSNIYGGVIRADLHRIGIDDHWYLQDNQGRLAIEPEEQQKRQLALIEAIIGFIASPTGAKVAAWAPHIFKVEGAIVLSKNRTAPFVSPISVAVNDEQNPVKLNSGYLEDIKGLNDPDEGTFTYDFSSSKELIGLISKIETKLNNTKEEENKT